MEMSIQLFLGLVLLGCSINGVVGALLGTTIDKLGVGFIFGFFLTPLGWILLFLLPRQRPSEDVLKKRLLLKRRPERNVASDSYRLWLAEMYGIKKNEVFGKYSSDLASLYETLDEALHAADERETEREEIRLKAKEANKRKGTIQTLMLIPLAIFASILIVFLLVLISLWVAMLWP